MLRPLMEVETRASESLTTSQINESGLKIFSIEDLQSAAEKSVQFSKVVKMGKSLLTSIHCLVR